MIRTVLILAALVSVSLAEDARADGQAKEIQATFFKLNGKTDFHTTWDAKTYSGRVEMRVYWSNFNASVDKNSMDIGQSRVQRLVSPSLPATCQINSMYGPIAPAKPVFAYTVSFGLWGIGCDT